MKKKRWWVVTIIDYHRAFSSNCLESFEPKKAKDRMRKMLTRCGFEGPVVGTFELDYHESCNLWLPHFHLICPRTKTNRQARHKLRTSLNNTQKQHIKEGKKPRPLMFQKLKNPYTQISYVYKLLSFRVIDCIYLSGKRGTKKRRLYHAMFCKHLYWLDSIDRRVFLFSYGERGWK